MEMESEVFIPNLKTPRFIALVGEKIGQMSNGSSPHRAGALKLGLKRAIELRKERMNVVQLRCGRPNCPWNIPVAYAFAGQHIFCQDCLWGFESRNHLQCTGCGTQRTGIYPACRSCEKKFI
jgi:hypothetical protein